MSNPTRSEDGRTENPDFSIFIAEDKPAQPFARFFSAPLPVKNRYVLATTDNAEMVSRRKRLKKEADPLAAYRRIRKPMPPPEKVLADKRRKLEEEDAERQIREEP